MLQKVDKVKRFFPTLLYKLIRVIIRSAILYPICFKMSTL